MNSLSKSSLPPFFGYHSSPARHQYSDWQIPTIFTVTSAPQSSVCWMLRNMTTHVISRFHNSTKTVTLFVHRRWTNWDTEDCALLYVDGKRLGYHLNPEVLTSLTLGWLNFQDASHPSLPHESALPCAHSRASRMSVLARAQRRSALCCDDSVAERQTKRLVKSTHYLWGLQLMISYWTASKIILFSSSPEMMPSLDSPYTVLTTSSLPMEQRL